ncbi:MAG: DUF4145 domain-containing protein [Limisphaerales bacterium]
MNDFNWTCPFCDRDSAITIERYVSESVFLTIANSTGPVGLQVMFIVCPNQKCCRFTLKTELFPAFKDGRGNMNVLSNKGSINQWNLIPDSRARTFKAEIPEVILQDYREACLIRDLSPKASATLSRRCLQGIIRDYWKVKTGRLVDEIKAIEEKIDSTTWQAIDAIRKVGNIGAHMEKDIDLIVEVDPSEAQLLIGLIELLLNDWYVARERRNENLAAVISLAQSKDKAKTKPAEEK